MNAIQSSKKSDMNYPLNNPTCIKNARIPGVRTRCMVSEVKILYQNLK